MGTGRCRVVERAAGATSERVGRGVRPLRESPGDEMGRDDPARMDGSSRSRLDGAAVVPVAEGRTRGKERCEGGGGFAVHSAPARPISARAKRAWLIWGGARL